MKVMIAAGGTGGHIYPAVALAEVLKERDPKTEVVFFGSNNRMESTVIPSLGYRFHGIRMFGMNGRLSAKIGSAVSMLRAEALCRKLMREEKPDIVVGFGNYISVPLVRAAHHFKIPTVLHEQNSYAGKANRFLARIADKIVGCYESNLRQFPAGKTLLLGNPEASIAAKTKWDPSLLKEYGLKEDAPFVICMMGSLGSSSVSKVIDDCLDYLGKQFNVIVATGKSNSYTYKHVSKDNIQIVEYVDGKQMLKGCALAVLRAGATTMAEIGAIGTPSILIPSPYVPNNHQYYNARELSDVDGAVLIEEKDLNAKGLADTINELMANPERREILRANAYRAGKRDAAEKMVDLMEELIGNE